MIKFTQLVILLLFLLIERASPQQNESKVEIYANKYANHDIKFICIAGAYNTAKFVLYNDRFR